jgi:hypothetical protein
MHRAREDRAGRRRRRGLGLPAQVLLRIGHEFLAALRRAKIIRMPVMLGAMLRRVRIDHHAADGIFHAMLLRRARRCVVMMTVSVRVGLGLVLGRATRGSRFVVHGSKSFTASVHGGNVHLPTMGRSSS